MIKGIIARCGHSQHPVWVMQTAASSVLALLLVWTLAAIPAGASAAAKRAEAAGIDTARLAQRVHQLVNAERRRRDLASLAWADSLAAIARAHSREMAANARLDHNSRSGLDPSERAESA